MERAKQAVNRASAEQLKVCPFCGKEPTTAKKVKVLLDGVVRYAHANCAYERDLPFETYDGIHQRLVTMVRYQEGNMHMTAEQAITEYRRQRNKNAKGK